MTFLIQLKNGKSAVVEADHAVHCHKDFLKFENGWFIFSTEVAGFMGGEWKWFLPIGGNKIHPSELEKIRKFTE